MPWFLYSSACVAIPGPMTQATSPTAAQKPSIPPLALSQAQRARTRQAVRSEDTEVSFALKPAKGAESFEPSVGAKVPNTLKSHPLPADLSNATLEALCIHQIQAPGADCDTDDAQDRRHVSGILGSGGSRQLDCKRRGNSREPTRGEGLHGEPGKQG